MLGLFNIPKVTSPLSGRLAVRPDIYVVSVELSPTMLERLQALKGEDGSLDHTFEKVYGCCCMMGELNPTREDDRGWRLTDMRTAVYQVVGFGIPDGKPVAWILPFRDIPLAKVLCDMIHDEKVLFKLRLNTPPQKVDKMFLTIDAYAKEV
jgi:hypothetical protein